MGPVDALDGKLAAADLGEPAPAADPAAPGAPLPVSVEDADREKWIGLATEFGPVLRAALPDHVQPHWTDERLRVVGEKLGNCARFYKWKFSDAMGHPVLGLLAACFPLAWPIVEPIAKPYLLELMGRKEKPVNDPASPVPPEPPAAPSGDKPVKVAPIG